MIGGPSKGLCSSAPCLEQPVARAVGAVVVSPALQRGVGETNNPSGVPKGRRPCSALFSCLCEKNGETQTVSDFCTCQTSTASQPKLGVFPIRNRANSYIVQFEPFRQDFPCR